MTILEKMATYFTDSPEETAGVETSFAFLQLLHRFDVGDHPGKFRATPKSSSFIIR